MARTPDETKKPARKPAAKPQAAKATSRAGKAAPAARKPRAEKPAAAAEPVKAKPRARTTSATLRAAPKAAAPKLAARKPAAPKPNVAKPAVKPAAKTRAPRKAKEAAADPGRLDRLVEAARKSLDDDKAENIVVLDVTNRASYADRLIIATGFVGRQIEAMAAHLDTALAEAGLRLRRSAVSKSDDWVLIDAGDLIIHLFTPEGRLKFDLEKMWGPDSPLGEAGPGEQSPI